MKPKRATPFPAALASRKMLEADGWLVGTVESQIPHTFIKRDLFGFADLIAVAPTRGIMLVQVTAHTSTSNYHDRVRKIQGSAEAGLWLASRGRIQVHSWEKSEPAFGRGGVFRGRWCRVLEIESHSGLSV